MQPSAQHSIWNRAAMEAGGPAPREGDLALAAALAAHGLVMNCGVEHALEVLTPEQLVAAQEGFRYLGLDRAAKVFESAASAPGIDSDIDRHYGAAIPSDEVLLGAFAEKYRRDLTAFAPIERGQLPNTSLERTREG